MREAVEPQTGSDLVATAREAWGPFRHGGVAGVGLNGLRRTAPSGWTFGGLVAHVAAWHDVTADRLAAYAATGEIAPPPADEDAFNAAVAARAAAQRPSAILAALDRSWERLVAVTERLTAEHVAAHDGWAAAVFAGNTHDHYAEHRDELRSVRPGSVDALVARYDADWPVFRDAVGLLVSAGRLTAPASDSWQMRDVIAHATGWLVEAVEVIPEYVAGRPRQYTAEGIDRQNAAAVEARRERSETDVVAELDRAHGDLRAAIRGLRDEDVRNPPTLGIIAACSYLHWDEHLEQIGAEV